VTTLYPQAIYGKSHDRDPELVRTMDNHWLVRTPGFPAGVETSLTRYRLFNAARDISPTWDAKRYMDRYAVGIFPLALGDDHTHILVEYQISSLLDSENRFVQMQRYVNLGWIEHWQDLLQFAFRTRNDYLSVYHDQSDNYPLYQFGKQPPPFARDPDIAVQSAFLVIDALFSGAQIVMQGDVPDRRDKFTDWRSRSAFTLLHDVLDRLPAQLAPYVSFALGDVNPKEAQAFDVIICTASDLEKHNHRTQHRFHREDYYRRDGSVTGLYASLLLHDKAAFANRALNPDRYDVTEFLDPTKRPALERAIVNAINTGAAELEQQPELPPPVQQQQPIQTSPSPYDQPTVPTPAQPSERIKDIPPASRDKLPPASTSGPVPPFMGDSSYSGKPAQPPSTKLTHKHRRPSPRQGRQHSRGIIIIIVFIILFIIAAVLVLAIIQRNTPPSSPDVTMTADPRTQTAIVYALTSTVQAEFLAATQTAQANILTQTQQAEFLAATQTAQANQIFESTVLSIIAATAAQQTLQAISAQAPTAPPTPLPTNSPIAYAFVTGDGLEGICLNLRASPVILPNTIIGRVAPNDAYAIYEIRSHRTQTENTNFLRIHSSQQYWIAERSGTSSEIAVVQYPDIGSLIEAHPSVVGFSNDELVEALSRENRDCSGQ